MEVKRYSTGSVWETAAGYSRAIRVGNTIFTAGTVAADESGKIHGENCYEQCKYIFEKLSKALEALGGSLSGTVKTTCFLLDLGDAEDFMRAHSETFGDILPAATCVKVAGLFGDGTLAEIELTAIVED